MATIEKTENNVAKEHEVYPASELFNAIAQMLNERTPIKIVFAGDIGGDIVFSVKYLDLGLGNSLEALSHPFFRTNAFTNFLGELLVRQNLDVFAERVMVKRNYDALVCAYNHKDFGLRTKGDDLFFTCHISLIFKMYNERLCLEIAADDAKTATATVRAKRVKRCEERERITTFTDNDNLRLIVPKTNELRICLENALETVLNFYGVMEKEVFITNNMFNFQIEVSAKAKEK